MLLAFCTTLRYHIFIINFGLVRYSQLWKFLSLNLIYLIEVLCHFQHCTGHITMGSFVGRGNQYIQLVKVLYCKLPTINKQPPTFPHKDWGLIRRPQTWEVSVLPLCHHGPPSLNLSSYYQTRLSFILGQACIL